MGVDGGLYKTLFIVHMLTLIFGFGPLVYSGVYAVKGRVRERSASLAVSEVHFDVARIAQKVVYAVFVTGALLVLASDDAWDFGSLWVSTSILSYIVALGISHGMVVPNARRMLELQRELVAMDGAVLEGPPEQAVELADRGKRAAAMGAVLNLILVFIIYLMVFKPTL